MFPDFPQSMPNLQSLTLELDDIEGWNPLTDPFESLTHTLEGLELLSIPLSPSLLTHRSLTRFCLHHRQFNLYASHGWSISLHGPNGIFSYCRNQGVRRFVGFVEFPFLPLTNVREFRLEHHRVIRSME